MHPRLRALFDLTIPAAREQAGVHDYDGVVQDLSPAGVRAGLARLGGDALDDPHDEAHLRIFEDATRAWLGEFEEHRRSPLPHLFNLDLSVYDRGYAPQQERAEARRRHLAAWPDAVDAAVEALDRVPAPVAAALLPAVRGLGQSVSDDGDVGERALAAHRRFVAHLQGAAEDGDPDTAIGATALARLLGAGEGLDVDLAQLAERADAERDRLSAMLQEACAALAPGEPVAEVVAAQQRDHPDTDGVLEAAREMTDEVIRFTRERSLVADLDGECLVDVAPASRRWAMAMMAWAGPFEDDAPSYYYITPPDPAWPDDEQEAWLEVFSPTMLSAITIHEVAPGHFAHSRALRRARSDVRKGLHSLAFAEGWAHYAEELCMEEGFRDGDPRYALGVAVEALIRVTRFAAAIGLHTGAMSVDEAAQRFHHDAFQGGEAARSEARRGTFDPTYGRYTWGKLAILDLREQARREWGASYSHARFHAAMLALGSPPLGLLPAALGNGAAD